MTGSADLPYPRRSGRPRRGGGEGTGALTTAAVTLDAVKRLSRHEFRRLKFKRRTAGGVKIACLAPLVALR
jgi:hypothetical protein